KLKRVERGEHRREVVRESRVAVQKHDWTALAARDEVQTHALDLDELARLNLPRHFPRTPYHKRTPLQRITIPGFGIKIQGSGKAVHGLGNAIPSLCIAIPGLGIALPGFGITIPAFSIAIPRLGIAIPGFRIAILSFGI